MHSSILATLFGVSGTAVAMGSAGIALFLVGVFAAKEEIAEARGLERIVALGSLCFGIPLAVFGALHLFGARFVVDIVPAYMPWRLFWAYSVGCALERSAVRTTESVGRSSSARCRSAAPAGCWPGLRWTEAAGEARGR